MEPSFFSCFKFLNCSIIIYQNALHGCIIGWNHYWVAGIEKRAQINSSQILLPLFAFYTKNAQYQSSDCLALKSEWYFRNIFHPIVIIRPRNWICTTPRYKDNFFYSFPFHLHPILFQLAQACWFEKKSVGLRFLRTESFFLAHSERIKYLPKYFKQASIIGVTGHFLWEQFSP